MAGHLWRRAPAVKERSLGKVLAAVVIAGSAHLVNPLGGRPGRAAGAVLALTAPGLVRRGAAAVPMGAAAALIADDPAGRTLPAPPAPTRSGRTRSSPSWPAAAVPGPPRTPPRRWPRPRRWTREITYVSESADARAR
ncbi:hypothetical protein AB0901_15770 [Streptomyces roseifaciens]